MSVLELGFASGEDSLSVRRFSVREALSSCFEVSIRAVSSNEDLPLDGLVGQKASFRIVTGAAHHHHDTRLWTGICNHIQQVQAEATGLSTYELRIVPPLWLLTQRRNYRIFQHLSIVEMAEKLLLEWQIEPVWMVDRGQYPKLEMRIQYGESDYAFLSRLLEEAGITFYFHDDDATQKLVLHDKPNVGEGRAGGLIGYVDNPNQAAEQEYVTSVLVTHDVRPGRVTIRDVDFRRNPEIDVLGQAGEAGSLESLLEQVHYLPGAFLTEGHASLDTPLADAKGVARHDDRAGKALAERTLASLQATQRRVSFSTNVLDLAPGVLFGIAHHARSEFAGGKRLLVTEFRVDGAVGEEWTMSASAVFAQHPYRPAQKTPKPQIHSVQSAVVVGPKGEDIYTDEFGRVRVQFPWDREGKFEGHSSCWMRVSQGWAGSGFGMMAIPRVGQEVLVGFLEGNPDQPVVVGRLYNNTSRVPYKLPENKTVSTWKSNSSPGSDGFNEIRFDDAKDRELVYVQAQRNLTKLVKLDEMETTGVNRTIQVGKRLTLTTGEASIVLDGDTIAIQAKGGIQVRSQGSDVILEGFPNVKINPGTEEEEEDFDEEDDDFDDEELGGDDQDEEDEDEAEEELVMVDGKEVYSEGILLQGSPEFRQQTKDALDRLQRARTGRILIRKLSYMRQPATIVESKSQSGACKAANLMDANRHAYGIPGKGSPSTVSFNPSYTPAGTPSEVVLGANLIRAYHNSMGEREPGITGSVKDADLKAIGLPPFSEKGLTENRLRQDLDLSRREKY